MTELEWADAGRIAVKHGLSILEVRAAARALFDYEVTRMSINSEGAKSGAGGQVVCGLPVYYVECALRMLSAARQVRVREEGDDNG